MQSLNKSGRQGVIVLIVIVVLGLVIFFSIWGGYNKAVRFEEAVKSSWAQVENQLTRRFDLIPNLVNTIKGYAKHEKELFENIADAKTKYFQAKGIPAKAKAATQVEGFLSRLMFLQERFPTLKANENFLKFQDQLEGTENRIAVERMRYNEAVRRLNTYNRSFFGRFFCKMTDVGPAEYFEAPEEKKAVPKVEF